MMKAIRPIPLVALTLAMVGAGTKSETTGAPPAPESSETSKVRALALPGAQAGPVFMDHIAYDAQHHRLWVPAGNTGSVDVVDTVANLVIRIVGFATAKREGGGRRRTLGPSSVTIGDGAVYVGNRGDSRVCAINTATLRVDTCATLVSMPDGLAYVAATQEVWVTTPRDRSIVVLSASGPLVAKARIALDGEPEGFAVDNRRGVFFTNLEDTDQTLVIDLHSRQVLRRWQASCGKEGPRGLALDGKRDFLMVACTDHVVVLDVAHDGGVMSRVETGIGLDSIDYVEERRELYAAAAATGKLTVARLDETGILRPLFAIPTVVGARNAVATERGVAYLTDSPQGAILIVTPPPAH